jgi:hypothetical protein
VGDALDFVASRAAVARDQLLSHARVAAGERIGFRRLLSAAGKRCQDQARQE